MTTKQKYHRPKWDEGFYLARSDNERIAKPRPQPEVIELPRCDFDLARAVAAWSAIGVKVSRRDIVVGFYKILLWRYETLPRVKQGAQD